LNWKTTQKDTDVKEPAIRHDFNSPDEETRRMAVHQLHGQKLSICSPLLFTALGDASWRVRKEAVEVLVAAKPSETEIQQLISLLRDEDNAGLRNSTSESMVRLGKKALPALISHLHDDDHDLRKLVVDALGAIGGKESTQALIDALSDPDMNVAAAAAEGLGTVGDRKAVPFLLKGLQTCQNDFLIFNILGALGQLGEPGPLPVVVKELARRDIMKRAVYECLGRIGCDSEAADILLEGALSSLPGNRKVALRSLAKVVESMPPLFRQEFEERIKSSFSTELTDFMIASFDMHDLLLSESIISLLTILKSPKGVTILLNALSDDRLHAGASRALRALGAQGIEAALPLFGAADEELRSAICLLLGTSTSAEPVLPVIRHALKDSSSIVRKAAVTAAGRLGSAELLADVADMLEDEDIEVREEATIQLRAGVAANQVLIQQTALQLAASPDSAQRHQAAMLFAALNDGEKLGQLMKDVDPVVREAAVQAVGTLRIGGSCSHLVMALVDEIVDVRIAAAEALGECSECSAIPPLRLALQDNDSWVKAAAMRSLVQLAGEEALGDIISIWNNADDVVLLACIEMLELIGTEAALHQALKAVEHPDTEVAKAAIKVFSTHDSYMLMPKLQQLLSHLAWDVRIEAVRACANLPQQEIMQLLTNQLSTEDNQLVKAEILSLIGKA
jgi:HEAT repeat protein